jgi:hypothetical protein
MDSFRIKCRNTEGDYVDFEYEDDDCIDILCFEAKGGRSMSNVLINMDDAERLANWLLDLVQRRKEEMDAEA